MEGLRVIPRVVHLVGVSVLAMLKVACVLMAKSAYLVYRRATRRDGSTLVARTIWSRMPRFSAHSPMNSSEVSS